MKKTLLSALLLLASLLGVYAQNLSGYAGLMAPYRLEEAAQTAAPAGYKPFYISHYGRHGSRYHISFMLERYLPVEMIKAREAGALTSEGEAVLDGMLAVINAHQDRDGDLSGLGDEQLRGIAERMYKRWPEVFRCGSRELRCRSSLLPRCIMSMSAFGTRLQQLDSRLDIQYSTGIKDFRVLCHHYDTSGAMHAYLDSLDAARRPSIFDADAFARRLFKPGYELKDPQKIAYCMFHLGCVEPGIGMGTGLFSRFTAEELQQQWMLYDEWMYGLLGNSVELGQEVHEAGKVLMDDFISRADAALAGHAPAADLRFGHDSGLMPLLVRMGIRGLDTRKPIVGSSAFWSAQETVPCASNLQLVWYRRRGAPVLVKILLNEHETGIPALTPVKGPYYNWEEVRKYWKEND